jgi:sec-independent protein translocase protein TatA
MGIGDLFDSPWKILIVAVVIIVFFGSRKLPDAARSLGRSMRILKSEVQGMHGDEPSAPVQATTAQATPAPAQIQPVSDPQAQIAALQEQIDAQAKVADLQKQLSDLQQQQQAK